MTKSDNKEKSTSIKQLKEFLVQQSEKCLQKFIVDLYGLSVENRNFIEAQACLTKNTIDIYKQIIKDVFYPDFDKPIKLSVGRKAISDYKKASGDELGVLDLEIYYVEIGTKVTLEYGDMYEEFYNSLEAMFTRAIKQLQKCPKDMMAPFIVRLKKIVKDSVDMGWGYHDYLADSFHEAFPGY